MWLINIAGWWYKGEKWRSTDHVTFLNRHIFSYLTQYFSRVPSLQFFPPWLLICFKRKFLNVLRIHKIKNCNSIEFFIKSSCNIFRLQNRDGNKCEEHESRSSNIYIYDYWMYVLDMKIQAKLVQQWDEKKSILFHKKLLYVHCWQFFKLKKKNFICKSCVRVMIL